MLIIKGDGQEAFVEDEGGDQDDGVEPKKHKNVSSTRPQDVTE